MKDGGFGGEMNRSAPTPTRRAVPSLLVTATSPNCPSRPAPTSFASAN